MDFNLKKAPIHKALTFQKNFPPRLLRALRIALLILGALSLGAYFLAQEFTIGGVPVLLLPPEYLFFARETWLALALIFLPVGLWLLFFGIFFHSHLKHPKIKNQENVAELLDFDAAVVLARTLGISKRASEKEISTQSLLLALVRYGPAQSFFMRVGLSPEKLAERLDEQQSGLDSIRIPFLAGSGALSGDLQVLLADAAALAKEHNHERVTIMDLVVALFDAHPSFKQLVIEQNLDKEDLAMLAAWYERYIAFFEGRTKFWRIGNLLRITPIGVTWVYGYPLILRRFTRDLTLPFRKSKFDLNLVDRENEIAEIQQTLSQRDEANILLVGEKGVGKRTIILKLAQRISEGKALPRLNYKRILQLNIPAITASSEHASDIQNTLTLILEEATKVGNIILFIPGLQDFIGALGGLGRSDISAILMPYLESNNIQIVATTVPASFHKYIQTQTGIVNVFGKIDVKELSVSDVMQIMEDLALVAESQPKSKLFFTYGALKAIAEDADKYVQIVPFPEKAVDLFNEVASYAESKKLQAIRDQDVHDVVSRNTGIPLGELTGKEKERLMALDTEMHREIIGQEQAVTAVAQTMQRLRAGLARRGKPAGVFLFVGPTGVGKTLTAKVLAETYFGSKDTMVRFDMSEYQNKESLDRLLGSVPLNEPGQLATEVRDNPFSLLLLDEIEKAHKDILNIFLQVFDEGKLTDAFGKKASFEQNIIIATSNAGSDHIREMIQQGVDPATQKEKIIDLLVNKGYFRPELLNRFDEIVIFHPLSREQTAKIADILVRKLVERLREQGYFFSASKEIIDYIAEVGFDPQFGARPMARAIQDKLENVIAKKILGEKIQKGVEFTLTLQEIR